MRARCAAAVIALWKTLAAAFYMQGFIRGVNLRCHIQRLSLHSKGCLAQDMCVMWQVLMAAVVVISVVRALAFFEATFHAATRMNLEMSARVLRAPLAFFHTNPAGRVLNRFSKDQGAADDLLPQVRFGEPNVGF